MFLIVLLQLLILGSVGFAGCWVAQRAGFPRVVGGVLAGLLLGPMVLGNVAPGPFHYIFMGDHQEHRAVTELERERSDARQTLEATGVTAIAMQEFDAQTQRLLQETTGTDEPAADVAAPRRVTQILLIPAGLAVLIAAGLATPLRSMKRDLLPALPTALAASGFAAAAGAGAGWLMVSAGWYEAAQPGWWIAGLAVTCACASAPTSRALFERMAAPPSAMWHPPKAATLAALIAFGGAAIVTGIAACRSADSTSWLSPNPPQVAFYAAIVGFIVLAVAMLAAAASAPPPPSAADPHRSATLSGGLLNLGQPLLFAIAGLKLDLTHVDWVLLLLVALATGEGKGLPALIVERTTRRVPWLDAMAAAAVMSCGGALPILLAMVLLHGKLIDGPLYSSLVLASMLYALMAVAIVHGHDPTEQNAA